LTGKRKVDPHAMRAAVAAVLAWLDGGDQPARAVLAEAVRSTLRTLEQTAPGHTVEVRVPPFAAIQCIEGPRHTRGIPPNVVEMDPRTWLELATGRTAFTDAVADGRISASGTRADLTGNLPIVRF
jgi:hypothetical protein